MIARLALPFAALLSFPALAEDAAMAAMTHGAGDHGSQLYWGAGGDADWSRQNDGNLVTWDDAYLWYGGDEIRLRLESEGEADDEEVEAAELIGLLSFNVADFWDFQAGVRQDFEPSELTWATVGFQGMAPYFIEMDARLFVSTQGDVSLRVEGEYDFQVTQQIVVSPHAEASFYGNDIDELDVGEGLGSIEVGLLTRYEITRKFAPYIDLVYERLIGETSNIAAANDEDRGGFTARIGVRLKL